MMVSGADQQVGEDSQYNIAAAAAAPGCRVLKYIIYINVGKCMYNYSMSPSLGQCQ